MRTIGLLILFGLFGFLLVSCAPATPQLLIKEIVVTQPPEVIEIVITGTPKPAPYACVRVGNGSTCRFIDREAGTVVYKNVRTDDGFAVVLLKDTTLE